MRYPGIEPGSHEWQSWILPLDQQRYDIVCCIDLIQQFTILFLGIVIATQLNKGRTTKIASDELSLYKIFQNFYTSFRACNDTFVNRLQFNASLHDCLTRIKINVSIISTQHDTHPIRIYVLGDKAIPRKILNLIHNA